MKRYELIAEKSIDYFGRKLFRIRALVSFGIVKAGDYGGYIESENNLAQDGTGWIFKNGIALGKSTIWGGTIEGGTIRGGTIRGGTIRGGTICGGTIWGGTIWGGTIEGGTICGGTIDGGTIEGGTIRGGTICGGTIRGGTICGGTIWGGTIRGGTIWGGTIRGGTIRGGTIWGGTIRGGTICGGTIDGGTIEGGTIDGGTIRGGTIWGGTIKTSADIFVVQNIGSEFGVLTAIRQDDGSVNVNRGCFIGTLDEFRSAVIKKHGGTLHEKGYLGLANYIEWHFTELHPLEKI